MRWLLQWNSRKRKAASSLVVFLRRVVPTAAEMRVRERKYTEKAYALACRR